MRIQSSATSVSWIPSEAIRGVTKLPFEMGITRYDDPPPASPADLQELLASDRFRFINDLRAWIEVEGEHIVDCGYEGSGHINVSKVRMGRKETAFAAIPLPDIQKPAEIAGGSVRFVQTAGGRTAFPAPRRVRRKPFVQIAAPLAWTTLALTIKVDGSSSFEVVGASPFPRHWVYDQSMELKAKVGLINFDGWYREVLDQNTPWGNEDSPALVTEVETALERELSERFMSKRSAARRISVTPGETIVEQGEPGDSLFLVLDGVLVAEIDGKPIAELGPGAILGERALLEGGTRTATLRAVSACRVARLSGEDIDPGALAEISRSHRREATD